MKLTKFHKGGNDMSSDHNEATICSNGHVVSENFSNYQKYCSICGEKTFSICENCKSPIQGSLNMIQAALFGEKPYTIPYYCHSCGSPYPWTIKILDNAVELISLDEELDDESKELIKNAIPNLIVDTPATPLAVAKYKKGMKKAGKVLKDCMYNLLIDVVSETVKKMLF